MFQLATSKVSYLAKDRLIRLSKYNNSVKIITLVIRLDLTSFWSALQMAPSYDGRNLMPHRHIGYTPYCMGIVPICVVSF